MSLTKTKSLIAYIVKKRQDCTITEILKLCYLIDLGFFRESNGKKITDYKYIRYNYGPFDSQVYVDVNDLVKEGVLDQKSYVLEFGEEIWKYNIHSETDYESSLLDIEENFVDGMLSELANFNAYQLTQIAYRTDPMKKLGAVLGGKENLGVELSF